MMRRHKSRAGQAGTTEVHGITIPDAPSVRDSRVRNQNKATSCQQSSCSAPRMSFCFSRAHFSVNFRACFGSCPSPLAAFHLRQESSRPAKKQSVSSTGLAGENRSCGDRNFVQAAACTATTVAHNLSLWATAIRLDRGKNGVARPAVVARGAASGSEATGRTT